MLKVRPYKDKDYPAVARILKEADMFQEISDNRANLASMIKVNPEAILVAEIDGRVIGNLYILPFGKHLQFIFRFAIDKKFRNQGIGTEFLKAAQKLLKRRGARAVALFVDSRKKNLFKFYEDRGYEKVYSLTAMRKRL